MLLLLTVAAAAAAAADPFDLYIYERYLNKTTGRLCRTDGCACEATSGGMPPLRDFRFDGICLSYDTVSQGQAGSTRSLKFESKNNRIVCENTYGDTACTDENMIDQDCHEIGSCVDGFGRYTLLEDQCIESETPQGPAGGVLRPVRPCEPSPLRRRLHECDRSSFSRELPSQR